MTDEVVDNGERSGLPKTWAMDLAKPPGTVGFGDPILQLDDLEFIRTPILEAAFTLRRELGEEREKVRAWRESYTDYLKSLDYWVSGVGYHVRA